MSQYQEVDAGQYDDDYQYNRNSQGFEQQSATNVKNHIKLVEDLVATAQAQLQDYKREYEALKQQLSQLRSKIEVINEETGNTTRPTLTSMLKNLKLAISAQKEENGSLQNQITVLKKEKSQIQQLILASHQKLAKLEEQVGSYN
ncbi:hypothetical protein PPERSA_04439 [Pseudocohnilembus persalinus]|uniref:Uncharacterized protein n=1 Tax=Pseudocohnilembus persalinus TaxID=266149 RepID=A0A0V0QRI0_PSEPJ|nr:hypothetical protein PPERSA_04439 [Pseudocohnilembus persalinus]|eukprot:KRX04624.1 hypothetical protein PPERSA_04439 [Pseudocohnilembus persalinus]